MSDRTAIVIARSLFLSGIVLLAGGAAALIAGGLNGGRGFASPLMIAGGCALAAGGLLIGARFLFLFLWQKRAQAAAAARLKEDECLLTPIHVGKFTENGLAVYTEEDVFSDPSVADVTPYEDVSICYFTVRALPQRAGREEKFLVLGEGEQSVCLPMDGRTERLARQNGVKTADRRFPAEEQKVLARFFYRTPHHGRRMAVLFTVIALLLAGAIVAGACLGGFRRGSLGGYLGACALVLVCSLAACSVLLRREKLVVYERGIRLHFFLRDCNLFLPLGLIQTIKQEQEGLTVDVGFTYFYLPDGGAYEFLCKVFPEKCRGGERGEE